MNEQEIKGWTVAIGELWPWGLLILAFIFFIIFRKQIASLLDRSNSLEASLDKSGLSLRVGDDNKADKGETISKQELLGFLNELLKKVPDQITPGAQLELPEDANQIDDLTEVIPAETLEKDLETLLKLGNFEYLRGKNEKSLKYFNELLERAQNTRDTSMEGTAYGGIGLIHLNRGNLDDALTYQGKSLAIHQQVGYKRGVAIALGNLGLIHCQGKHYEVGLKYMKDSLALHKSVGYRFDEQAALGNIGISYLATGDTTKALKYTRESITISKEIEHGHGIVCGLGNIGAIHDRMGDSTEALKWYEKALSMSQEYGFRHVEASIIGNIALICRERGELDAALKRFRAAHQIFRDIGAQHLLENSLLQIKEIEEEIAKSNR
jgi:tetratricopeptide (TPR) repeat protein